MGTSRKRGLASSDSRYPNSSPNLDQVQMMVLTCRSQALMPSMASTPWNRHRWHPQGPPPKLILVSGCAVAFPSPICPAASSSGCRCG